MRSDKEYKELTIKEFCAERDRSKTKSSRFIKNQKQENQNDVDNLYTSISFGEEVIYNLFFCVYGESI